MIARLPAKPPAERLILGIGAFSHDSACALMRGGKVLFAAEQERFDRVKHSRAYPFAAIEAGLRHIGASFDQIDEIAVNYDPARVTRNFLRHLWDWFPGSLRLLKGCSTAAHVQRSSGLKQALADHFHADLAGKGWHWIEHHLCHAASAFYRSPFERAAILTSDSLGEFDSVLKARGEGTRIEVLQRIPFPHSVGTLFSAVTDHLGFKVYSGEGTVMGLAGYGKARPGFDFSRLAHFTAGGGLEIDPAFFRFQNELGTHSDWVTDRFARRFGPRRHRGEPVCDRHADLARSLQDFTDASLLHFCRDLHERTALQNVCYAGGVALNGYANTRAMRESPFGDWYIQPAANDGGTALGAALYFSHHVLGVPRCDQPADTFLGPGFSDEATRSAFREVGVSFRKVQDACGEAAGLLAADRIVGWVQGRMELGPRALGHRSILANPCRPWMKDRLNTRIKHRELFRPFAPIVPEERAAEYFVMPCRSSPYMLLIMDVKAEWREKLSAITHIDGTARVQTVTAASDPKMHRLLYEFERQAGVPVLLNTSFNGPDEPIVCTPADAIRTFQKWGLDALVIGEFVAERVASPNRVD